MKNIKFFALAFSSLFLLNCADDDKGEVAFNGDALLHFNKGTAAQVFVFTDTGFSETVIEYGVLKPVTEAHTVKLVPDVENSTAVLGVDYEIIDDTDELEAGETGGTFTVKLLEEPAIQDGKKIVFKLESATLSNTVYNDMFTLDVNLSCPVESFVGDFNATTWWLGNSSHAIDLLPGNQLAIRDFWEDHATAPDFILSFNPDTFVVTFVQQSTGYMHPQGEVYARPNAQVSSFNPCTRVLTVHVNYWIPGVGTFGDKVEVFTGI